MGRPAATQPRVQVRMPEEMRLMLQHRAVDGYRSLNAEIISLIERGIAAEKTAPNHTA